jgi:hypothetical protein
MRATVDDREIGQVAVHLKPNEATSQEIIYTPRTPGVQRGRFEISADAFPDDDTFMFTLHVVPAMKIVVVNGFSSPDPFQSESLFVMNALRTEPEGQLPNSPVAGLGPSSDFIRSLDVHEISEAALTAAALDGASVVVLANTGGLNVQQCTWLREFTAGGGGLLIFPGDKVSHETYSKQLLAAPAGPLNPRPEMRVEAALRLRRSILLLMPCSDHPLATWNGPTASRHLLIFRSLTRSSAYSATLTNATLQPHNSIATSISSYPLTRSVHGLWHTFETASPRSWRAA